VHAEAPNIQPSYRSQSYPYNSWSYQRWPIDKTNEVHIGALNEKHQIGCGSDSRFLDGLIKRRWYGHCYIRLMVLWSDPGYAIVVKDSNRWQRLPKMERTSSSFSLYPILMISRKLIPWKCTCLRMEIPDGNLAVAIGRHCSKRPSRNTVRYDHGGLSFAEWLSQVCDAAHREKKIDFRFEDLP